MRLERAPKELREKEIQGGKPLSLKQTISDVLRSILPFQSQSSPASADVDAPAFAPESVRGLEEALRYVDEMRGGWHSGDTVGQALGNLHHTLESLLRSVQEGKPLPEEIQRVLREQLDGVLGSMQSFRVVDTENAEAIFARWRNISLYPALRGFGINMSPQLDACVAAANKINGGFQGFEAINGPCATIVGALEQFEKTGDADSLRVIPTQWKRAYGAISGMRKNIVTGWLEYMDVTWDQYLQPLLVENGVMMEG